MREYLFNTTSGELLVAEDHSDFGKHESSLPHVVPLADLLTAEDFPYKNGDFQKPDFDHFERQDYLNIGRIVLDALSLADVARPAVTTVSIERMHYLGLSPSRYHFVGRRGSPFGSFPEFQRELGSPVNTANNTYADWSMDTFESYTKSLIKSLGRLPKTTDYRQAARKGMGPSYDILVNRTGGMRAHFDRLGYPDVLAWEKADFVDWGVQVVGANPDIPFVPIVCTILSPKRRGPSKKSIQDKFNKWSAFKEEVMAVVECIETPSTQELLQEKVSRYQASIEQGDLPKEFAKFSPEALVAKAARYMVAERCLPQASPTVITKVTHKAAYIDEIIRRGTELNAGIVENVAVRLDVFDDIWPPDKPRDFLRISPAEYAHYRTKETQYAKQRKLAAG